jgi:hypothetical protein
MNVNLFTEILQRLRIETISLPGGAGSSAAIASTSDVRIVLSVSRRADAATSIAIRRGRGW